MLTVVRDERVWPYRICLGFRHAIRLRLTAAKQRSAVEQSDADNLPSSI
jgi:hypothetical protein